MGTKRKSPKQGLFSVEELTIELPERRESSYHRLEKLTNLNYSLIYGPSERT